MVLLDITKMVTSSILSNCAISDYINNGNLIIFIKKSIRKYMMMMEIDPLGECVVNLLVALDKIYYSHEDFSKGRTKCINSIIEKVCKQKDKEKHEKLSQSYQETLLICHNLLKKTTVC